MKIKFNQAKRYKILGGTLIIVALILTLCFLLKGSRTVSGQFPEPNMTSSIVCESTTISYPFFRNNNSQAKRMTIKGIFNKDEEIENLSVEYRLEYTSSEEARQSESENHAEMNLNFAKNHLGADALNAKFSKDKTSLLFSIFATSKNLNNVSLKYFLLESASDLSSKNIINAYKKLGFSCQEK